MLNKFKTLASCSWTKSRRLIWKIHGYRILKMMGLSFKVEPGSSLLLSWKDISLKNNWKHEIVRHTDMVQLHALCETVSKLPPDACIVEVGAYHGEYALLLGSMIKEGNGRLLAIEPNPISVQILLSNIHLNGLEDTVIVEPTAVSDHHGTVELSIAESETKIINDDSSTASIKVVSANTLTAILKKHNFNRVDLLLIDAEGAELPVLKSFPWNEFHSPVIFCEMHPYNWKEFGYSGEDVSDFLRERKLKCMDMYLQVYTEFKSGDYIGPCLLLKE